MLGIEERRINLVVILLDERVAAVPVHVGNTVYRVERIEDINLSRSPQLFKGWIALKKIEAETGTTQKGFYVRTIFRLAKPAFFKYNENFTLERDLFVRDFCNTGNT